jgi:hypothetical protein
VVLLGVADEGVRIPGSDGDGKWLSVVVVVMASKGERKSREARGREGELKRPVATVGSSSNGRLMSYDPLLLWLGLLTSDIK